MREQYAVNNTEKKILWANYHDLKNSDKEIDNAWANVKALLNLQDDLNLQDAIVADKTKGRNNVASEKSSDQNNVAPKKKERNKSTPSL